MGIVLAIIIGIALAAIVPVGLPGLIIAAIIYFALGGKDTFGI